MAQYSSSTSTFTFEDIRQQADICQVYTVGCGMSANADERRNGFRRLQCPSPQHSDSTFSFDVNQREGFCKCFGCGLKGDVFKLVIGMGRAQTPGEALRWIVDNNLVAMRYDPTGQEKVISTGGGGGSFKKLLNEQRTGLFPYFNANNELQYQVLRFDGLDPDTNEPSKRFVIRRRAKRGEELTRWKRDTSGAYVFVGQKRVKETYVAEGGEWSYDSDAVERIPYRLPELLEACAQGRTVFSPEGEGKADAVRALGLVGTTNAGGANWPWPMSWTRYFEGTQGVVVLTDCDIPGRAAARERTRLLRSAGIRAAVLDLKPEYTGKYDIRDWLKERKNRVPAEIVAELKMLFVRALTVQPPLVEPGSITDVA